jgi:hypothetical protein
VSFVFVFPYPPFPAHNLAGGGRFNTNGHETTNYTELFSSQETKFAVEWADAFLSPPCFLWINRCGLTQTSGLEVHPHRPTSYRFFTEVILQVITQRLIPDCLINLV